VTWPTRAHNVTTGLKDLRGNPPAPDSALIGEGQLLGSRTDLGAALPDLVAVGIIQASRTNRVHTFAMCVTHGLQTDHIMLLWLFTGSSDGALGYKQQQQTITQGLWRALTRLSRFQRVGGIWWSTTSFLQGVATCGICYAHHTIECSLLG
jgi:hypothetical protein